MAMRILKGRGDGLTGLLRSYPSPNLLQVAVPNLSEAVQDADLLVFVIPHQFIHKICDEITGKVPKKALGITLIKVTTREEQAGVRSLDPASSRVHSLFPVLAKVCRAPVSLVMTNTWQEAASAGRGLLAPTL